MPDIRRLLNVMRKGERPQRLQVWGGVVLFVGAGLWLIYKLVSALLPSLAAGLVALVGLVLIRRALRSSPPSS